MPYMIKQGENGDFCVYTQGEDKKPSGKAHGCHPTEEAAKAQMRALYANVEDVKTEGKAILLPISDDGDPFKIDDLVAFEGYYDVPQTGGINTTGSSCLGYIRAISNGMATIECLDVQMQPTGSTCIRPLTSLREYVLPGATATAEDVGAKSGRIEVLSSKPSETSPIEYKSISGFKPESVNGRTVDGIAAVTGNIDDNDDITHRGAFRKTLQEQGKRVMFTFNHELDQTPRARIDELKEISRNDLPIQIKSQFPQATGGLFVRRTYLETPRGEEAFQGVITGAIPEMSYGYQAIKKDRSMVEGKSVRNLWEVRLIDICDTTLGVNPATMARKALPFRETPKAGEGANWDAAKEVAKADTADLKAMCAWVDTDNSDDKTAYKLPHHLADGEHAVVWDGVKAAMGALMGARGGVDIPDADKKAVYSHLAKHYEQFGEEPPDFKSVEIANSVRAARALLLSGVNFKAGRMISAANQAKIKDVIDALEQGLEKLEDLLGTAEPPAEEETEGKALTDPNYLLGLLDIKLMDIR